MNIDGIDDMWSREKKNVFSLVYQKFEITRDALTAAEEKIETLKEFFSQPEVEKVSTERMLPEERLGDLKTVSNCELNFDSYKEVICKSFECFVKVMKETGKFLRDDGLFDIAEHVVKIFILIDKKIEQHMKRIDEISEKFRNVALMSRC